MANTKFEFYPKPVTGERFVKRMIRKFGRAQVGNDYTPITFGTPYRMNATAEKLRIKAGGNSDDNITGVGAQQVTLEGLDGSGNQITEILATAGSSASQLTRQSFSRLYTAFVSRVGTYYETSSSTQPDDITIEDASGTDWCVIDNSNAISFNESEIGAFTVPVGFQAYIGNIIASVDTNRRADFVFCSRENALQTGSEFSPLRAVWIHEGFSGLNQIQKQFIHGPFTELTDLIFYAKTNQGNAIVSVDFEIALVDVA